MRAGREPPRRPAAAPGYEPHAASSATRRRALRRSPGHGGTQHAAHHPRDGSPPSNSNRLSTTGARPGLMAIASAPHAQRGRVGAASWRHVKQRGVGGHAGVAHVAVLGVEVDADGVALQTGGNKSGCVRAAEGVKYLHRRCAGEPAARAHPMVGRTLGTLAFRRRALRRRRDRTSRASRLKPFPAPRPATSIGSPVSRAHGAPQSGQQPRSDVPALMQTSGNSGGNVAKCAFLERLGGHPPTEPFVALSGIFPVVRRPAVHLLFGAARSAALRSARPGSDIAGSSIATAS